MVSETKIKTQVYTCESVLNHSHKPADTTDSVVREALDLELRERTGEVTAVNHGAER